MLNVSFDTDVLRQIIREEVREAVRERFKTNNLPPLLTRKEMMDLLHIGPSKATELIARADFPVFKEAGLLIPTDKLFRWIDKNTRWVEENTGYFKAV